MKEIVYIAGDGRSGSTLLDMILSNMEDSISIGEGYRFWKRFYEGDTFCGCGDAIESCDLWQNVHLRLKERIPHYDPVKTWNNIQELLKFGNVGTPEKVLQENEIHELYDIIRCFYDSIIEISGKSLVVDSSKSVGWLHLIVKAKPAGIKIIQLERKLPAVVNSWKKEVSLPEYRDKRVMMPTRSNYTSVKTYFKIILMMRSLRKKSSYFFLKYEDLLAKPSAVLTNLSDFLGHDLAFIKLNVQPSHSIGGNPMRNSANSEIVIRKKEEKLQHLNIFEKWFFTAIYHLSKSIL